jgi:hypothetical protein
VRPAHTPLHSKNGLGAEQELPDYCVATFCFFVQGNGCCCRGSSSGQLFSRQACACF